MNNIICRPKTFLVAQLILSAVTNGLKSEETRKIIVKIKMEGKIIR